MADLTTVHDRTPAEAPAYAAPMAARMWDDVCSDPGWGALLVGDHDGAHPMLDRPSGTAVGRAGAVPFEPTARTDRAR